MLDPKKLVSTIESAMKQATQAQVGLQSSFMASASSMAVDGPGNSANVMSSIAKACQDMATQMEATKQAMDADVVAHHAAQKAQKPGDFDLTKNPIPSPT